jgi:hypothetical protein
MKEKKRERMTPNRSSHPFLVLFCGLLSIGVLLGAVDEAEAKSPLRKLRGSIVVSTKRFPSQFKSDKAMLKYMKKVNSHEVRAKEGKDWEFEYMAFLRKPVATLQASVTFYDITDKGTQRLVNSFAFYTQQKKDKILNGHSRLSRTRFQKNRKYLMVFSRGYGQPALAKTIVVLRDK